VKVVMSADELAKEDGKKRVKRADANRNGSISATELCQIVPSTVLLPILSLLSPCRINNIRVIDTRYACDTQFMVRDSSNVSL